MKCINLPNSKIIEIGDGNPVIGIVGLIHGDECCGRIVLDELASNPPKIKGKLKLIYSNLEAEKISKRGVEGNLNRTFPGRKEGNLEEKTAFELAPYLSDCNYVLDIHSTSYPTEPFVISLEETDNSEFDKLASFTGLSKYVIMTGEMASGGSLLDEVYRNGGKGISIESGTHEDESSINIARGVINNFLKNLDVVDGKGKIVKPEKFYSKKVIRVPSDTFEAYDNIKNFELLKKGVPYGKDNCREYSLDEDCYPFLFSDKLIDRVVFLSSDKAK